MGSGVCRVLLGRGWRVVAVDKEAGRLAALAAQHAGAPVVTVEADLGDPSFVEAVRPHVDDRLEGLVNLAGVSVGDSYDRLDFADWSMAFRVNVDAPMLLCQLCGPLMSERGRGSIVNVSSPVGLIGARKPSYSASKAALTGLTMTLARSLGPRGVRVNLLLPGTTLTHMTQDWSKDRQRQVAESTWLRRLCTGEEVGNVIAFLLSDDASYVTGSIVDMTAGGLYGH